MVYKPDYLRNAERSKDIVTARKWGISVISALIGLGLVISEIQRIKNLPFDIMNIGYITLLVITGFLIFSWIWATQKELDMLLKWSDPERYEPPSNIQETLLILAFAVLLVALLFASRDIFWYSFIFFVYNIINLYGLKKFNTELLGVLGTSKTRAINDINNNHFVEIAKLYIKIIENFESYFIKRPHKLRLVLTLIASAIAFGFSICWMISKNKTIGLVTYILLILMLIISEYVIWNWRSIRDSKLRPIIAELNELIRNNNIN